MVVELLVNGAVSGGKITELEEAKGRQRQSPKEQECR